MNCEQYKDLIQEFHDGELPRQSEALLFMHLSSCEECREFLKLLNLSSVSLKEETLSYPSHMDERILRGLASAKKVNIFTKSIPAYITYAITLMLIAVLIFSFNSSSHQKSEIRQVINVLNEQNSIVREQNKQLQMLMNGLPEASITSELENKIIINANM